jgi:hypothetical protein
MPPKYKKSDYVKVLATRFDSDDIRDRAGRTFSEQWAHEGNGIWCFGTVSRVYVKKGRQPQKYSIRYDGGQTMTSTEDQIEPANEDDADEESDENERQRDNMYDSERDSDNQSTDVGEESWYGEPETDSNVTEDDEGAVEEGKEDERGDEVEIGETVSCGANNDPKRLTWTRIKDIATDQRTDKNEDTVFKNKWQMEDDDESVFWKFVSHLIPQIDPRPRHERQREEETDPTARCIQIRLGEKRTVSGKHKGMMRPIQGRCTSCGIRKKLKKLTGNSPRTAWGCACHRDMFFCHNKTCWSEHLKTVREQHELEFAI